MIDAHSTARRWLAEGRRVAEAVLVETIGSSPLDPGAAMFVDHDGAIEGSVTGGCVEGALFEEAQEVLRGGEPRVLTYGISDEVAAGVGLTCGGTVRIFLHELLTSGREAFAVAVEAAEDGRPAALAALLDGPGAGAVIAVVDGRTVGSLGGTELLDRSVAREARGLAEQGVTVLRRYGADGATAGDDDLRVHVRSFAAPPQMVIFGAVDFSVALARHASGLGYDVTICDAREPFARSSRLTEVARVVVDWPQRHLAQRRLTARDAVLVFTHDPKFDEPALLAALEGDAGYIGAMGSRRTQASRFERLRAAGASDEQLARIAAPCGLDIGARTPDETAISVLAEIVARRTGRAGVPLAETSGSIRGTETATRA